jgi:WD40 repeat protein
MAFVASADDAKNRGPRDGSRTAQHRGQRTTSGRGAGTMGVLAYFGFRANGGPQVPEPTWLHDGDLPELPPPVLLRGFASVSSISFSADGTAMSTSHLRRTELDAFDPGSVRVWTLGQSRPRFTVDDPDQAHVAALSPDGQSVASDAPAPAEPPETGADPCLVDLWDAHTGQRTGRLHVPFVPRRARGHDPHVRSLAYSPDGRFLAAAATDRKVYVWDLTRDRPAVTALTGPRQSVGAVAFSPDGRLLAAGSMDHHAHLWIRTRGRFRYLAALTGHTDCVDALAFTPDGEMLATAGHDGTVLLWDVLRRARITALTGHTAPVAAVSFGAAGALLATAAEDGTVRLWHTAAHRQLRILTEGLDGAPTTAFTPDGTRLITPTTTPHRGLTVWDTRGWH